MPGTLGYDSDDESDSDDVVIIKKPKGSSSKRAPPTSSNQNVNVSLSKYQQNSTGNPLGNDASDNEDGEDARDEQVGKRSAKVQPKKIYYEDEDDSDDYGDWQN